MNRQEKLPTAAEVNDKRSDLAYKQGQLESAETTYARLKVELEKTQADLEKIKSLEARLDDEYQ